MTDKGLNPFSSQEVTTRETNSVQEAESAKAIQEVQAAMVIAKRFPRDRQRAMDNILNDCTRESLAKTALYSYPKGGQEITGPSIRLAETMAQNWGNMQYGIRELSVQNNTSSVEAFAWDIETNTRQTKTFQVSHERYTRAGGITKIVDPRDIYEHVANMGARRLRACILGIIPGDVTEAAVKQCDVTLAANIDVTPESIKKMLDTFLKLFGITDEMISQRIGKKTEAINPPQMLSLRKIYASINDGMSKPADWFDVGEIEPQGEVKTSDLNASIKNKQPAKEVKAKQSGPSEAFNKMDTFISLCNTEEDLNGLDFGDKGELWAQMSQEEVTKLRGEIDEAKLDIQQIAE